MILYISPYQSMGLLKWLGDEESIYLYRRCGFDPWVKNIPWRRKWYPTPALLTWEILWTEESGGLWSIELQRVGHD